MYSGVWVLFATAHDGNAGGMTPAWVHVHGRPATRAERARASRDRVDRARRTATSTGERGEGGAGPMTASLCRC